MKSSKVTNHQSNDEPHHQLCRVLSCLNSVDEVACFLSDLCTPAELQAMADRWLVVAPLKKGKPYRQIQAETGVSVTTIGRVARCLSEGGGYELAYQKLGTKSNEQTGATKDRSTKEGPIK